VSVRDIVVASNQKNGASLHYYFRSKEALVRELVADGAKRIDGRRNQMLDELEARKRPPHLREIIVINSRSRRGVAQYWRRRQANSIHPVKISGWFARAR
jgi:AcrR family transcriptional regulator